MRWVDTKAIDQPLGDVASELFSDWEVVWERVEGTEEGGYAKVFLKKDEQYQFTDWWWGDNEDGDEWDDCSDSLHFPTLLRAKAWLFRLDSPDSIQILKHISPPVTITVRRK